MHVLLQGHSATGLSTPMSGNLGGLCNDNGFKVYVESQFLRFNSAQLSAHVLSPICFLQTTEDKELFAFAKISQQVDDLFENTRLRNTHRCTFCPPKNLHLVIFLSLFLYLSSHSCLTAGRKAQHPSVEQAQSGSLEEVGWTTMPPFSLQEHQHHNFGSTSIWLRPSIGSWTHSPRPGSLLWFNIEPEGVKLPARANKWNDNFHIINSSHGLRSISSHTLFIFDTLGRFYLCTPTNAKPNTIYSQMHSIMWVYLF